MIWIQIYFISFLEPSRGRSASDKWKSQPRSACGWVDWTIVKSAMKKNPIVEPIISPELLRLAQKSVEPERGSAIKKCAVCGTSCTPLTGPHATAEEDLCWVCRRLKISAWRESDQQLSAQE